MCIAASFQAHLELKNSSRMSWHVFVTVSKEKLHVLQNNHSLLNFCLWGCKAAALLLMSHNFFVL